MERRFEGNIESQNNVNELAGEWNFESERPIDGMEQPFSNDFMDLGCEKLPLENPFGDSNRPETDFSNDLGYDGIEDIQEDNSNKDVDSSSEVKNKGLTDEEKQELKEKTGWPDAVIDAIGSKEEAEVYEKAGLEAVEVDGKWHLIRGDIDLDQLDEDGISNKERMERGRPPLTKDGEEIELHHIGQKADSPLAELTTQEHRGVGNDSILHDKTKESEIDRNEFSKERKAHWKSRVNHMEGE